ncbi:hypothetical protein NKH85_16290 [Mesorhizobium sp. M0924]|uniref:hypothetical protein n=1 Tax=unclassified Mesorhizobium TaxID=325217 RepID=UPI003338A792
MILSPQNQKDLGDLVNLDPAAAEKAFRQLAQDFATQHFGIFPSPKSPHEIAELVPQMIELCVQQAAHRIEPGRILQMQHAARASFYERLRVFAAAGESPARGGTA